MTDKSSDIKYINKYSLLYQLEYMRAACKGTSKEEAFDSFIKIVKEYPKWPSFDC